MLSKLFGSGTIKLSSLRKPAPAAAAIPVLPEEHPDPSVPSMPLRIVHAGGFVERYYMAVPAVGILEKYPQAVLARPDIFRRPWDSIVQPEEILIPGDKVYVVPRRTIKKLRQRSQRPAVHGLLSKGNSSEGKSESNMPESKEVNESIIGRATAAVHPRNWRLQMEGIWQPSLEAIGEA